MARSLLLPWCCAMALTTASVVVEAQNRPPRISVGPFTGQRVDFSRGVVASALSEHAGEVDFVPANEFSATASRLGVSGSSSDETLTRVASELRLDAVIVGNLERRGDSWRLQVRVLRGRDAHIDGSVTWEMNRVDELTALRSDVWDQLSPYLHLDAQRPNLPPRNTDRNTPVGVITPTEPEGSAAHETAHTPGLGWLQLAVGAGLSGRSWRVPVLGEPTPRAYENGAFGEMQLGVTLLGRWAAQRSGFGPEVRIAFPLALSSLGRDAAGRSVALATSAFELELGVVFVRRPSFGGVFRLGAGVIVHSFSIDTERLAPEMRLARMSYVGGRVAGEGQLPFVATAGWEFGALFGGELRVVGVGAEARQAFGMQPDTTLGFGSWFGLYGRLDQIAPGLGVRASAEFVRYRTAFAGSASIGTVSDSVDDFTRYIVSLTYAIGAARTAPAAAPADPSHPTDPFASH